VKSSSVIRLAQVSDLHFGEPTYNPSQFFSKRWLGNLNLLFSRKRDFCHERLLPLIDLLRSHEVDYLAVTGDFSVTAQEREFEQAAELFSHFSRAGIKVLAIPGNHDQYTGSAYKKQLFYRYFPPVFDERARVNLRDHKVTAMQLANGFWIVGLDTARSTSLISSQGVFSEEIETELEKVLSEIPSHDKIILLNHFPFFQNDPPNKQLVRAKALRALITRHPNIVLYLHGHTHRQTLADLRPNQLPILSDTGSSVEKDSSAFHLFHLDNKGVQIDLYQWEGGWTQTNKRQFKWNG